MRHVLVCGLNGELTNAAEFNSTVVGAPPSRSATDFSSAPTYNERNNVVFRKNTRWTSDNTVRKQKRFRLLQCRAILYCFSLSLNGRTISFLRSAAISNLPS